jgi:hypothetical protein
MSSSVSQTGGCPGPRQRNHLLGRLGSAGEINSRRRRGSKGQRKQTTKRHQTSSYITQVWSVSCAFYHRAHAKRQAHHPQRPRKTTHSSKAEDAFPGAAISHYTRPSHFRFFIFRPIPGYSTRVENLSSCPKSRGHPRYEPHPMLAPAGHARPLAANPWPDDPCRPPRRRASSVAPDGVFPSGLDETRLGYGWL